MFFERVENHLKRFQWIFGSENDLHPRCAPHQLVWPKAGSGPCPESRRDRRRISPKPAEGRLSGPKLSGTSRSIAKRAARAGPHAVRNEPKRRKACGPRRAGRSESRAGATAGGGEGRGMERRGGERRGRQTERKEPNRSEIRAESKRSERASERQGQRERTEQTRTLLAMVEWGYGRPVRASEGVVRCEVLCIRRVSSLVLSDQSAFFGTFSFRDLKTCCVPCACLYVIPRLKDWRN